MHKTLIIFMQFSFSLHISYSNEYFWKCTLSGGFDPHSAIVKTQIMYANWVQTVVEKAPQRDTDLWFMHEIFYSYNILGRF